MVAVIAGLAAAHAETPTGAGAGSGDVVRGERLYADVYRCYACHGYDGQSGEQRLVPLRFSRPAFLAFVRAPNGQRMPSYAGVPEQDLLDVYAYLGTIPADAPDPGQTGLLRDIRERQLEALAPR